jgi:Zinc carboxypeptidase
MKAWLSSSLTIVAIVLLCDAQVTYPRSFYLWSSLEIHSTILKWGEQYPSFLVVQTSQEAFGLPSAGKTNDCPFDGSNVGCLNYFGVIQDYVVNPIGSTGSNQLPTVLLSGALHGNERVGPTAVMETASLLLAAAACESTSSQACRKDLTRQGIIPKQRRWLARLVRSRRIILVPTANALGYYRNMREEGDIDPNRDFPFDQDPTYCMRSIAARTLNELFLKYIIQLSLTYHAGIDMIGYEWGAFPYENNDVSPDDVAQSELATGFSKFAGGWVGQRNYPIGTMNDLLYPVNGGMEDWAYAG